MPTLQPDETYEDWMERCIPIVIEDGTAEDNEQAIAVCDSLWEEQSDNLQRLFRKLKLK